MVTVSQDTLVVIIFFSSDTANLCYSCLCECDCVIGCVYVEFIVSNIFPVFGAQMHIIFYRSFIDSRGKCYSCSAQYMYCINIYIYIIITFLSYCLTLSKMSQACCMSFG